MIDDASSGEPPGSTTAELTAAPPAEVETRRPRRSGRTLAIIAAIGILFLLVLGYVIGGAAAAAGPVSRSDAALKTAVSHNNTMAEVFKSDPWKEVDFKSDNLDVSAAKSASASFKKDLSRWQGMVTSDRKSLQSARSDLNNSFLTIPEQGTINGHRARVDAALSALGHAQQALNLANQEFAFLDEFLNVIGGFQAISKAADAKDLGAMQSQLATTAASMQKTLDLAKPPAVPAEAMPVLKGMQQIIKDMQALVSAAQSGNDAGVERYSAAVEADGKALDAMDTSAFGQAITALFKPLGDAYDREMKVAAGG